MSICVWLTWTMADWCKHPCLASLSSPASAALSQIFLWTGREHMLTFHLKCFLCGLANDVKEAGCHLETLSAISRFDSPNRSWNHTSCGESVSDRALLIPVRVCTLMRRFNESSALWIYTCEAVQDFCSNFITSPACLTLTFTPRSHNSRAVRITFSCHLTCTRKSACTC